MPMPSWRTSKPCPNCKKTGGVRKCQNCGTLGCVNCVCQATGALVKCKICFKGPIINP